MMQPTVYPFLMSLLRGAETEDLAPSSLNAQAWEQIITDATRQGLLPILYRWIKTSDSGRMPPAALLDQVREAVVGLAVRNVLLAQELGSILRACEARGVACVPLRGLALAELLYGDITTTRPMGDLDLLVRKEELHGVAAILKGLGFQEVDRRPGFARAFSCTLEFFKERHGWVIVEPHWSIAYPPFVDRVDMDLVWKRCARGRVAGMEAWLLGRVDLLMHLCFHLIHRGESAPLLWLYELDRLLRQDITALDWSEVVFLTRQAGLEVFVAEALGRLKVLFDSPIPDDVLSQLKAQRRSRPAPALESRLLDLLARESYIDGGESFALLFTIKGLRTKIRYALALLFPSSQFMLLHYGLSSRKQLALSYLTRVVHFCWEGLKGIGGLLRSSRVPPVVAATKPEPRHKCGG